MNDRVIHDLVQGSPEWHTFRSTHYGASEAAAMLGLSKYKTRSDLLKEKATGITPEVGNSLQSVFNRGHETESLARPIVEKLITEDLYPATYSYGQLSASCDGLTMAGDIAFEHKQWNAALAATVSSATLPEEHQPQCQQIMMVTGAEKVLFVVSDGTTDNMVWTWVLPDPEWFKRIEQGWGQFAADLANYQHQEVIPAAVAAPVASFPILFVQAKGEITATNMPEFRQQITDLLDGLNMKPTTDQQFADSKEIAKNLRECAKKTKALKDDMLAQTADIGQIAKEIDHLAGLTNAAALALEKAVAAEEENRKVRMITRGQKALAEHIAALNTRLGKIYMPAIPADFAGALKSKRNLESMENGIDTELARAKIEASAVADRIQINMHNFRDCQDHAFLFPDMAQLVLKADDDCQAVIRMRIADHKEAEAKKAQQIAAAPPPQPATVALQVQQIHPQADTGATLKLGEIGNRLGFTLTADFLALLGFKPVATDKNSKLFRECDFPMICAALVRHISGIANQQERKAA